MEIITADSPKTELSDRVLWYDGDSTVSEKTLMCDILNGLPTDRLFVDEITPAIKQYNINVNSKSERIGIKESITPLTYDWNIPDEYKDIDVFQHVFDKLVVDTKGMSETEFLARNNRCTDELEMFHNLKLMDVLRTLIFVINTLIENKVVWGVGRGSSVASYVLYLMGVHDVDSFKYGLNIEEFLRTE